MSADLKQPLSRGTESSHARLSRHDLEDLPVALEHRKFADAAFCLLFSLFCAGMVVLAIYSVASTGGVNGYERLTNGVQFDGTSSTLSGRRYRAGAGVWVSTVLALTSHEHNLTPHSRAQGRYAAWTCQNSRICTGRHLTSTSAFA